MQTESFGQRLRAQRERQNVTLAAIAEQTKIKPSLLEGLERDDISRWPQGIFRRAYVRSYAKAIGLDPELIVRQFLEIYPDPVEETPESEDPPAGLRYLFSRLRGSEMTGLKLPRDTAADLDRSGGPSPRVAGEPAASPSTAAPARMVVEVSGIESQLTAIADLCTRLGCAADRSEIADALKDAMKVLNAFGVILWIWVARREALVSVLAHGYPEQTLARLPEVSSADDNAIGSAFRTAKTQIVPGDDSANGAVVAPLMTPTGCMGVLAIELRDGSERCETVRGFAMILAAQLATLIAVPAEDALAPPEESRVVVYGVS